MGPEWQSSTGMKSPLHKKLEFSPGNFNLDAGYEIQNSGPNDLRFLFLVEWNLTLLAGDAPDRNYFVEGQGPFPTRLFSLGEEKDVSEMGIRDGWLQLEVNFQNRQARAFLALSGGNHFPVRGGFREGLPGFLPVVGLGSFLEGRPVV